MSPKSKSELPVDESRVPLENVLERSEEEEETEQLLHEVVQAQSALVDPFPAMLSEVAHSLNALRKNYDALAAARRRLNALDCGEAKHFRPCSVQLTIPELSWPVSLPLDEAAERATLVAAEQEQSRLVTHHLAAVSYHFDACVEKYKETLKLEGGHAAESAHKKVVS